MEDQPSPAVCVLPPTSFSSKAAQDDSRGEKGEHLKCAGGEMAEDRPTFMQQQKH